MATYTDLIREHAKNRDITLKQAKEEVSTVFSSVRKILIDHDKLCIINFGSFKVVKIKGGIYIDNWHGEKIRASIDPYHRMSFTASKLLKDIIQREKK